VKSTDVEPAEEPGGVCCNHLSGAVRELQSPLVIVEALRVAGDAPKLQDPLRLA
jgi:hypothetical protein